MATTTDLSSFDEIDVTAKIPPETLNPTLPNGFHTLRLPDGGHRTFRVFRKNEKAKLFQGKRIIALLIGPDNTEDYEPFGFVDESGIHVWKRYRGHKQDEYAGIIWKISLGEILDGYELMTSKRCLICNRTLTDDESITRGIGPLCWERVNGQK